MNSNQDLQNRLTQGITFDFPQAYKFRVIFVKENIVYGLLIEPLTNRSWLSEYTWTMFQQLINKVLISHN